MSTEVSTEILESWLGKWCVHNGFPSNLAVRLRPHRASSQLLELVVFQQGHAGGGPVANIIFDTIVDRHGLAMDLRRSPSRAGQKLSQSRE
jgi:isocitrate lyase